MKLYTIQESLRPNALQSCLQPFAAIHLYNTFSSSQVDGDFDDYRKELLESLGETINSPSIIANAAVQQ